MKEGIKNKDLILRYFRQGEQVIITGTGSNHDTYWQSHGWISRVTDDGIWLIQLANAKEKLYPWRNWEVMYHPGFIVKETTEMECAHLFELRLHSIDIDGIANGIIPQIDKEKEDGFFIGDVPYDILRHMTKNSSIGRGFYVIIGKTRYKIDCAFSIMDMDKPKIDNEAVTSWKKIYCGFSRIWNPTYLSFNEGGGRGYTSIEIRKLTGDISDTNKLERRINNLLDSKRKAPCATGDPFIVEGELIDFQTFSSKHGFAIGNLSNPHLYLSSQI
jgi:hypothetical protein